MKHNKRCTHSSGSSCKYLSLLQQDLFGVCMLVDNDNVVGAHHQRVRLPVLLLQFFEMHVRRVRASQTQQTADHGQRREVGRLLGATSEHPERQLHQQQRQGKSQNHRQAQKPRHIHSRRALTEGFGSPEADHLRELCRKSPELLQGHAFMQLLQCHNLESEYVQLCQFKQDNET